MIKKLRDGARDLAANPRLDHTERRLAYVGAGVGVVIGLGLAGLLIVNLGDDPGLVLDIAHGVLVGWLALILLLAAAVWHRRQRR